MKKITTILISILITALLIGCGGGGGGNSQKGYGSLEIKVVNGTIPVENIEVIIEGNEIFTKKTNKDGIVFFENIQSGNYKISIKDYLITQNVYVEEKITTVKDIDINKNTAKYTFMFYANSYNLDEGLKNSVKQLYKVGSDNNINIIVLYKLSDNVVWKGKIYKNEDGDITKGLTELPNQNFGNSVTLENFIVWAMEEYPAENYILDLWDHGSGWVPYYDCKAINHESQDYNKDYLSIFELYNATIGKGINYLCFDACSMQFIEVLTQIKDCFNIVTGSENVIPSTSYNYEIFFQALKNYNTFEDAMIYFGKEMLKDDIWDYYDTDFQVTNLSKIDALNETIKSLANYLYKTRNENQYKIYESMINLKIPYGYGRDLGSFVTNLNEKIKDSELQKIVKEYKACEKDALIFRGQKDELTGFLVNLPTKVQYNSYFANYSQSDFSAVTDWDTFLKNRIK